MPVINRIADYFYEMQGWRHHMHSNPELGFECFETAKFVKSKLQEFGVDEIHSEIAKTGIVAIINGKSIGKTIGLRADMDALPLTEVTNKKYNIDLFLGIGGGPEGVISAAALDAYGCKFQGRFIFATDQDKARAKKMGISDLNKKYELNEIVKGDSIFCATGITSTEMVGAVKKENKKFITETLVTHKESTIEIIKSEEPIA